jgi:tripartite ATP-independent transporter DctM subunit
MTIGLIALAAVLILALLRVPLGFALFSVSFAGIAYIKGLDVARILVPLTLSEASFSYELAVVPMFILMGNLLSRTDISEDLFRAANAFLGNIRGGLALATMATCAGFAAVCGSSYATAATMAKVAYPSMKNYGYSESLATAVIAIGGTLGILIPPSIIMIIYGILTQTNVGDLFIAGVMPGLLAVFLYMTVIYVVASIWPNEAPRGEKASANERKKSLMGVWPFLLLFIVILGGLYLRVFTATEAGGIGAGSSFIISLLTRRLTWERFYDSFVETVNTSVTLYMVLFGAMLLSNLISYSGFAEDILSLVVNAGLSGFWLIMVIMLVFFVLGCVMESMTIIFIFVPLFTPILVANGFNLVWFGVLVVVATEIGMVTPPIGMNVFVLKAAIPEIEVGKIFRGLVPFTAVAIMQIPILVLFPWIALFLVNLRQ